MIHETPTNRAPYPLIPWPSVCFFIGVFTTLLINSWPTVYTLYKDAAQIRYEVMAGERGPVTYLVSHNNFDKLKEITNSSDDILGIEQHEYSNVAKIAFASPSSPAIGLINSHPAVESMIRRNVPMICH